VNYLIFNPQKTSLLSTKDTKPTKWGKQAFRRKEKARKKYITNFPLLFVLFVSFVEKDSFVGHDLFIPQLDRITY
jgi:hypothetical protein